jgi:UDP-2,3-diacylglucosamine pyrophosphatase LpxH
MASGFTAETISDTHLNLWNYTPEQIGAIFPGSAPNLVLAGDIGDPDEESLHIALKLACQRYQRVLYVPGNHEFYNRIPGSKKTPASTLAWFQKLDDQWSNFHFFYRRAEVYDGVRVLGATCWSTSPKSTTWANMISQEGKKDIDFLEQGISNSKEPVIVVTHYPSTLSVLQENYKYKITQYDYAQDLERMYRAPVKLWIFGHVHQTHDFIKSYSSSMYSTGNIRILCNPYGYPNDGITSAYPKQFTIPSSTSVKSLGGTTYRSL